MSEDKRQNNGFINARSMADELNKSNDPAINEQREYRKNIAYTTQDIVDKLDAQRLRDIELEFMRKATREELEYSIQKLDNHAICSGNVVCPKDVKCGGGCKTPSVSETQEEVAEVHGPGCHCEKCCPNPRPSWFKKHKAGLLAAIIFACVLILAVGWTPAGAVFTAMQNSYVDLIVNFFKVAVLAVAGFGIYKLIAKDREDE